MVEDEHSNGQQRLQEARSWSVSPAEGDFLSLTVNGTTFRLSRLMAYAIGTALVERSTTDPVATQPANDPLA